MQLLAEQPDLSPADQIAQDWALFRAVESGSTTETLRFWEAIHPAVIVGRGGRIPDDVFEAACAADGVPILRRSSGGGAVVVGPGSLNYALALSLVQRPELMDVRRSYSIILSRLAEALGIPDLTVSGTSDLALGMRKVSGSAQRRGRDALLHHGTLLYAFDPRLAERYLKEPSRQPAYRAGRRHTDFLGNLPLTAATIREGITQAWC